MDLRGEIYSIRILQPENRKHNSKSPSSLKSSQEQPNVYMMNENY
jgi:hypothetical protein